MSADSLVRSEWSGLNYLENSATAAFFEAREHEAYYRAMKHVAQRREFHERLIPVCTDFVALAELGANAQIIDELIAAATRSATATRTREVLDEAAALHPDGFRLLQLKNPLDFASLKSAYRSAALQHHPDRGGTTEAMRTVNGAFSLFHELLRRHESLDGPIEDEASQEVLRHPIQKCRDYQYLLGVLLLQVMLDEWNVDGAYEWFNRLGSEAWSTAHGAVDPWQRIQLIEPFGKLAARLHLARRCDSARRVLDEAVRCLTVATAGGLNFDFFVRDAQAVLDGEKKPAVTLKHRRQAENAIRLGVIDQKRYDKVMAKLDESKDECSQTEVAFRAFVAAGGFMANLPTDGVAQAKIAHAALVPEPGYFASRIEGLADDQQAEYVAAFSFTTNLALVTKYAFVRLSSLLRSAILHSPHLTFSTFERECRALASFQEGTGKLLATAVAGALAYLDSLAADDRRARLELLQLLHLRSFDSQRIEAGSITITIGSDVSPFEVDANKAYLKLLRLPLSELRTALETGHVPESEEARLDALAWNSEVTLLRTPTFKKFGEEAFAALDVSKSAPEDTIAVLTQQRERLIAMGDGMRHTQELQLGFWVDKLTIALSRLNRWQEALDWLERYFSLPERYRRRSNPSAEGALRKRLERCRKLLR